MQFVFSQFQYLGLVCLNYHKMDKHLSFYIFIVIVAQMMVLWVLALCRVRLFCHFKEPTAYICRVTEFVQSELCSSAVEFWLAKIHTAFLHNWHISAFLSLQPSSESNSVTMNVKATSFSKMLEQTYPTECKNPKYPQMSMYLSYIDTVPHYVFPLIWIFLGWFVEVILTVNTILVCGTPLCLLYETKETELFILSTQLYWLN